MAVASVVNLNGGSGHLRSKNMLKSQKCYEFVRAAHLCYVYRMLEIIGFMTTVKFENVTVTVIFKQNESKMCDTMFQKNLKLV